MWRSYSEAALVCIESWTNQTSVRTMFLCVSLYLILMGCVVQERSSRSVRGERELLPPVFRGSTTVNSSTGRGWLSCIMLLYHSLRFLYRYIRFVFQWGTLRSSFDPNPSSVLWLEKPSGIERMFGGYTVDIFRFRAHHTRTGVYFRPQRTDAVACMR